MASSQNSARQSGSVETTSVPDPAPSAAQTGFQQHTQGDETLQADRMASRAGQELSNFADLNLEEVKAPPNLSSELEVESVEESAIIRSEMEFDPENTPRDPVCVGSQMHSAMSTSSEDMATKDHPETSLSMEVSLGTIPLEILLHICEFLEAGVIINTLSRVCQAFHDLFTNEAYWQVRMKKRWPKKYPPVDCKCLLLTVIFLLYKCNRTSSV